MSRPISPEQYEASWQEPDWDACPECDGAGVYTVSRSRPGYLDEDVDVDCGTCNGTGAADGRCPTCHGAGGWQQPSGLIVECPRGCMTDDGRDAA